MLTTDETTIVKPYFENIESVLRDYINQAKEEISVAVAWFTNNNLFYLLLIILRSGVKVQLLILYDKINVDSGLNFQKLIDAGAEVYFSASNNSIMHNKYCIIDRKVVITGSYNFTYFAENVNQENIICITSESIANLYEENFESLLSSAFRIDNYSEFKNKHGFFRDIFSADNFKGYDSYYFISKENFVITRPIYERPKNDQWGIDKIKYNDGELVLSFFENSDCPSTLFAPKTDNVWKLISASELEDCYMACQITDIKVDNIRVVDNLEHGYYYDLGESEPTNNFAHKERRYIKTPTNYKLTCDIHFKIKNLKAGRYNLIEGGGVVRWNILNIIISPHEDHD